ncbi:MAG: LysR family transcriptional regulator [Elusimicrobia bacterium]|nr:LysR family transcriptional regulator [Elusimicrobiota bacterium]
MWKNLMIPLNYHHLYYFFVVAREGSIARATEKLLLAAPTISAQIRELETDLGRTLFERRGRGLHLTGDGRVVLAYARRVFDLGAEMRDALGDQPRQASPRAQIGVVAGFPAAVSQSLVAFLSSEFPGAHLSFQMAEAARLTEAMREHRLDLAVSDRPLEERDGDRFVSVLAARIPVRLAAAPRLARRLGPLPRALDRCPVILPSPPWSLRHQLQEAFARWKVHPVVTGETEDLELAWRMGIAGKGIVPVDERTLRALKGTLRPLKLPPGRGFHLPVFLTARERRWSNPLAERALAAFRG